MTKEKKYEEGHCPKCGSQRADVVAQHEDKIRSEEFDADTLCSILECRGCGNYYFKSAHTNSEETISGYDQRTGEEFHEYIETVKYWPPAAERRRPDWAFKIKFTDHVLGSLFDDVYTALSNNLGVLAAIGMRTVFDRASELLGIDTNKSFRQKLDALRDNDHVTEKEAAVLEVLIDAGSAAAHRGWRPKPIQLDGMMTILESFLHRAFLLEEIGIQLEKQVPKKGGHRNNA